LGDEGAARLRGDGLEDALDVGGDVVLGVPQVEVTGAALEVEEDDALGLAEAGAAAVLLPGGLGLLQAEEVRQAEAQGGRAADAGRSARGDAVTGVLAGGAGDHEQGRFLASALKRGGSAGGQVGRGTPGPQRLRVSADGLSPPTIPAGRAGCQSFT